MGLVLLGYQNKKMTKQDEETANQYLIEVPCKIPQQHNSKLYLTIYKGNYDKVGLILGLQIMKRL
jgi:hypothetical protein